MDSSGMWSLHHVSVIVAISALFSFSISDIMFGTTDHMFVFTTTGRSHFPHGTYSMIKRGLWATVISR